MSTHVPQTAAVPQAAASMAYPQYYTTGQPQYASYAYQPGMMVVQPTAGPAPLSFSGGRSGLLAKEFEHVTKARMANIDTVSNGKPAPCANQYTELTRNIDPTSDVGLYVRDMQKPLISFYLEGVLPQWAIRDALDNRPDEDSPERVQQIMRNIHIKDLKSRDKWLLEMGIAYRQQYLIENPDMLRTEMLGMPQTRMTPRKQARADQLHTETDEGECKYATPPRGWDHDDPEQPVLPEMPFPTEQLPITRTRSIVALTNATADLLRRTEMPTFQDVFWIAFKAEYVRATPEEEQMLKTLTPHDRETVLQYAARLRALHELCGGSRHMRDHDLVKVFIDGLRTLKHMSGFAIQVADRMNAERPDIQTHDLALAERVANSVYESRRHYAPTPRQLTSAPQRPPHQQLTSGNTPNQQRPPRNQPTRYPQQQSLAIYTDTSDRTRQAYATQYNAEPPPAQYSKQRQDRVTCDICKGPHESDKCWAVNPKEAPEWWLGPMDYESWLRYVDCCRKERLVPVQYRKQPPTDAPPMHPRLHQYLQQTGTRVPKQRPPRQAQPGKSWSAAPTHQQNHQPPRSATATPSNAAATQFVSAGFMNPTAPPAEPPEPYPYHGGLAEQFQHATYISPAYDGDDYPYDYTSCVTLSGDDTHMNTDVFAVSVAESSDVLATTRAQQLTQTQAGASAKPTSNIERPPIPAPVAHHPRTQQNTTPKASAAEPVRPPLSATTAAPQSAAHPDAVRQPTPEPTVIDTDRPAIRKRIPTSQTPQPVPFHPTHIPITAPLSSYPILTTHSRAPNTARPTVQAAAVAQGPAMCVNLNDLARSHPHILSKLVAANPLLLVTGQSGNSSGIFASNLWVKLTPSEAAQLYQPSMAAAVQTASPAECQVDREEATSGSIPTDNISAPETCPVTPVTCMDSEQEAAESVPKLIVTPAEVDMQLFPTITPIIQTPPQQTEAPEQSVPAVSLMSTTEQTLPSPGTESVPSEADIALHRMWSRSKPSIFTFPPVPPSEGFSLRTPVEPGSVSKHRYLPTGRVIVDSGSDTVLMSDEYADRHGLKYEPVSHSLRTSTCGLGKVKGVMVTPVH